VTLSGIPAFARTSFGIEFDHIGIGTLIDQAEDELALAAEEMSTFGGSDDEEAEED
jgi:hypothetical protein